MPKLTLDNQEVTVPAGATILDAARQLGVPIPTLCHLPGRPAQCSCLVCLVEVNGGERLLPACGTVATEGMTVVSESAEVHAARRMALELLLGDHRGDCLGPCQGVCPAHLDLPKMLEQIAAGCLREALITVKQRLALPACLGRVCAAMCERGCRRGTVDAPVSLRLLKRYVADVDLAAAEPYLPPAAPPTGRRAAIVGAGPTGLSAASYLRQAGHAVTIYEQADQPGGGLRQADLPAEVLQAEAALILRQGVELVSRRRVTPEDLAALRASYDAVLLAVGEVKSNSGATLGLPAGPQGLLAHDYALLDEPGLFAAGSTLSPSRHAARACGEGYGAAQAINAFLRGEPDYPREDLLTVRMGKLSAEELAERAGESSSAARVTPAGGEATGFSPTEAAGEAERCLHCECAKLHACALRAQAIRYQAHLGHFRGDKLPGHLDLTHPEVVYDPGKCIACGICVRLAEEAGEPLGLALVGRGLGMRPAVPFGEGLAGGLTRAAAACVAACPTGALAWRQHLTADSACTDSGEDQDER
ncbi:MAG TPA: 2Fe-2S iron-sulfur cluster-binding protein [Armatimonadota bacterium]|jgi:ferredoxin